MANNEDDDYPSSDDQSFKSFTEDQDHPQASHSPTPQQQPNSSAQNHDRLADSPPPPVDEPTPTKAKTERFPPEEEKQLLSQSNTEKSAANQLFGKGSFENAIQSYDRALASCPNYLDYEIAVLRSNISACHVKLSEWKEAVEAATKGLDCLERLEPLPVVRDKKTERTGKDGEKANDDVVEEVDEGLEERMENLRLSGHTIAEVRKLQIKMLMRRAKGKTEQGGWASLQGAEEDFKILLSPTMAPALSLTDKRSVMESARALAPKLNEAKDKEMAEMMGKLKGLGNSILKPFGLSTSNFQFQQDPKSGGYSMNFNQNPGGG